MRHSFGGKFAVALLFSVVAFALPRVAAADEVFNNRQNPIALLPGVEQSLQAILDGLFFADAPDAYGDQSNIASFQPTQFTVFTFLDGIAGYRESNVFGIYEMDGNAERTVFDGSEANGDQTAGQFSPSAQERDFLWFLDVGPTGDRMWSEDVANNGQVGQMLAYVGDGQQFFDPSIGVDGYFNTDDILIAFEDLDRSAGVSDDDFNDLVVLIENVGPGDPVPDPDFEVSLPEPGSLAAWTLIGIGLLIGSRRLRQS